MAERGADGQAPERRASSQVDIFARLAVAERLNAELKVRSIETIYTGGHNEGRRHRTRQAFICGFERAWRGENAHWTYSESTSDYRLAERAGREAGEIAVNEAIEEAIAKAEKNGQAAPRSVVALPVRVVDGLLSAAEEKLAECRRSGPCSDPALLPDEFCSGECVLLDLAVRRARALLGKKDGQAK